MVEKFMVRVAAQLRHNCGTIAAQLRHNCDRRYWRHSTARIEWLRVPEGGFRALAVGAAIVNEGAPQSGMSCRRAVFLLELYDYRSSNDRLESPRISSNLVNESRQYLCVTILPQVRYHEHFMFEDSLCVVMAYCDGGDLAREIKRRAVDNEHFTEHEAIKTCPLSKIKPSKDLCSKSHPTPDCARCLHSEFPALSCSAHPCVLILLDPP